MSSIGISPQAVIDPSAKIATDVSIGPFSVIGPGVEIGSGCQVSSHVVIKGPSKIGCDNRFFSFATIGEEPQDLKYNGEPTRLEIGDRNIFRESCTVNRGTVGGGGVTRIGDDNLIMAYVHIAHDCDIRNNTILVNNASLAGHVTIEDFAILGGFTLVSQFLSIGKHAFTAMGSVINKSVPPYMLVSGHMASAIKINDVGIKRRGYGKNVVSALKRGFKALRGSSSSLDVALAELERIAIAAEDDSAEINELINFIESERKKSIGIVR